MSLGKLMLIRFNGVEKFHIQSGGMMAYKTEEGVRLCLEIEADPVAIQTVEDTAEIPGSPSASVSIDVAELNALKLVGMKFQVPNGTNDEGEGVGAFYYYEHMDLDGNEVEILERREKHFRLRWTGITMDVNYYDGTKPPAKVQIESWFYFGEMDRWC